MGNDEDIVLNDVERAQELDGKLSSQSEEEKLMHMVLENDTDTVNDGKILNEAINQGMSTFIPDLLFEKLTQNYSLADKIFGERLIKLLTGYDPNYVRRNVKIPEFAKELKQKIEGSITTIRKKGLIDSEGTITDTGVKLASLILYTEELDHLVPRGILGEKLHKKSFLYGDRESVRSYKKGDRYKDFAIKKSLQLAIRRGHTEITSGDFRTFERKSKGSVHLIYALDASGSMRGEKINTAKKAGIALSFRAIQERDKVGLVVFGEDVREEVMPCQDFPLLLERIARITASRETNITETIKRAVSMFEKGDHTKHLILLTDAMPTVGDKPEVEALEAVSLGRSYGVTISVVGIQLEEQGKKLAEKISQYGEGRLYLVRNLQDMDRIILEDYYSVA